MRQVALRGAPAAFLVVAAVALGATLRAALPGAGTRAVAAALLIVLAIAPCVAAACHDASELRRNRWRRMAEAVVVTAVSAAAALLAAGADASVFAAAFVPAAAAVLALGVATAIRAAGAEAATATLTGAGACVLLAGAVFVADPWIEWDGAIPASRRRSAVVYRASPVAAALSHDGGVGVDWQRERLLYDGPSGAGGLSLVGQYYPIDPPPSPWSWAFGAAAVGSCLLMLAPLRREPGLRAKMPGP